MNLSAQSSQSSASDPAATIAGEPVPSLDAIATQHLALAPWVTRTPVFDKNDFDLLDGTTVNFKFELLQAAGSFKVRGAFSNLLALTDNQRLSGVTCVSAGNHAVAVAYAAKRLGINAKVVIIKGVSEARLALCRQYGAEILFAEDGAHAFEIVHRIEADEGRIFVHPFNGYRTVLGTATLGYEWATQSPGLEAVVVPIGGGGLAAGVASAFRAANPRCRVYGVEPEGANVMMQSISAGHPLRIGAMQSIADSLKAPHTEEYSFELCRRNLDQLVTVSEDALRLAMLTLFEQLKVAVEPACAAATAALLGPLRETLAGKRVGVLLCGSNTDAATFSRHIADARALSGT